MTIQDLINIIPPVILKRGEGYYHSGNILELNQGQDGTWYADVEGNNGTYKVEIKPDYDSQSADYYCDCPYDGAICKHVAAVALAINERKTMNIPSDNIELKEVSWEQLIKDAKLKDLRDFMLDYGENNHDFRHQIKLTFSEPVSVDNADNISYYESQINGIFENYEDGGFIDYRSGHKAMNDVSQFQIKADEYYLKGNLNEAFCISAAIAMEGISAIQYMDDSSGDCGGAICESFEVMENILYKNTPSRELRKRIFDWLHEQVQNSDYIDFGVGDSLESLFFNTAAFLGQLDLAYKFIDANISTLSKENDWSSKHSLRRYLEQKVKMLESEDRQVEVENIIDSYLHLENFRQIRVDAALKANNLKKVEKLILDGIKIAQKENSSGVVHRWKDQLLELYKQQKQTLKYHNLARELFLENTSENKYFYIFKQTSDTKDWEKKRDLLIDDLKNNKNGYYRSTPIHNLAWVYIEEQLINDLFELVRSSNSIDVVIYYTDQLKENYSTQLLKYYTMAIENAARNTGRGVYVTLVHYFKNMAKLKGGLNAATTLRSSLLVQYKNRPAMREEFGKLNWK
ncbi:SWIM zinc finger family protein [Halosquirtibacter laminarini]|uniref:SWIM zinc finger family protein n=1 Tax=Halosquirtibacter laminarini TaxID=3374600 RepID=A0AC61NJ38_9BACT|nr:SWIM zinc finger family protein [Prolixibacteraceae bacterium]